MNLRKITIYLLTSCNTEERIAQNIFIIQIKINCKVFALAIFGIRSFRHFFKLRDNSVIVKSHDKLY